MIDIHTHILPGADHGPDTYEQALAIAKRLCEQGVDRIVATPHQLGPFEGKIDGEGIVESCANLQDYLGTNGVSIDIIPGAEIWLDERIPRLLDERKVITLGEGGKYILLELIPEVFIDIDWLIDSLLEKNIRIVLAHPERYSFFWKKFDILRKWIGKGVLLQVTASSLLGLGYMPQVARPLAFEFLAKGFVTVIASDVHDLDQRAPHMLQAFELIKANAGEKYAEMLFVKNPERLLEGLDPVSV